MPSPAPTRSSSFTTDVLKLVTGTTFAQIIAILASPLLTRLYGPEAFGFLALFTSITSIIGVIACMRYEMAIMLPKTDEEAANLLGLCLLCVAVISGLTVPALYFGGDALLSLLKAPGLAPYLILVPVFVFISGVFLALNYWNSRTKHFGRLSVARITSSLATTGTQLGAGFAGHATGGSLIGANLVGVSVSTGVLGGQIWRDDHTLLCRSISWQGMISGLIRYKKFPLIDSSSALMNTVSWQLPAFLLAAFFSPVVVGFYALGMRILQLPMSLVGSAIAQVFFQRAAEAHKSGNLASLVQNIAEILLKIIVFPVLLLAVVGPELFSFVFGDIWGEAGIYIQILSIWIIFWFLYSPLSTIYVVLEKQNLGLRFNLLNLSTRFLSLLIGGMAGSVYLALALFSVSGVVIYGTFCLVLIKMTGVTAKDIIRSFVRIFAYSIPGLCVLIFIKLIAVSSLSVFVISCVLIALYYAVIYMKDPQVRGLLSRPHT
jgi:O-antigen/teichoic acid export membrane protein